MDTSNGAMRTLDYVIGRITNPEELGREEYADLFEYVGNLIYPFLSMMGMSPVADVGGALSYKLTHPFQEANLQRVRLMLAQQSPSMSRPGRPDWEVYLTEKGHWVIVLSRKRHGDVRIIATRDEFLEYYDRRLETGFIPPWHWLLEAPCFVVARATTIMGSRLQILEHVEETLNRINQRFFIVNGGSIDTP